MLDTAPAFVADDADWRTSLRVGDVVLFRFPVSEEDQAPEPKPRPCLVLDLDTLVGERFATIAYGTTSRNKTNCGEEIHVRAVADRAGAGLNRPTRFIGARRITVSLDNPRFVVGPGGRSPIIGHLDASSSERMHEIRARIHAFRDMAAERQSRRPKRRRTVIRGVDFVVESRTPRRRIQASDAQR